MNSLSLYEVIHFISNSSFSIFENIFLYIAFAYLYSYQNKNNVSALLSRLEKLENNNMELLSRLESVEKTNNDFSPTIKKVCKNLKKLNRSVPKTLTPRVDKLDNFVNIKLEKLEETTRVDGELIDKKFSLLENRIKSIRFHIDENLRLQSIDIKNITEMLFKNSQSESLKETVDFKNSQSESLKETVDFKIENEQKLNNIEENTTNEKIADRIDELGISIIERVIQLEKNNYLVNNNFKELTDRINENNSNTSKLSADLTKLKLMNHGGK